MTLKVDAVVVGGGIVGWSAAYRLARNGRKVAVVDDAIDGQATAAGAGIVSPGSSVRTPEAALPLAQAAVDYYPTLVAQLAEDGETNTGFASPGTLFIFQNEAEFARLAEVKASAERLRAAGFKSVGDVTVLTGPEAKRAFPALADLPGALHLSEGSRVDGRRLRDAMRRAALARGTTEVIGRAELGNGVGDARRMSVGGESIAFDALLVAAGAWTRDLCRAFGAEIPVAPQRGQILHLTVPDADVSGWPIIHGFHDHYMLTFPTDRVVAGATREDGSGFDFRITAGGVHQELGMALRVAPGLGTATLREVRVGFRPVSADGLPILGRLPEREHVYVATGHGPSGLTLGPVSGAAVADQMMGVEGLAPLDRYALSRFAHAG